MIYVLIFGVFYPLMAMVAWTAGGVGIGATTTERKKRAAEKSKYDDYRRDYTDSYYFWATFRAFAVTFLAGVVWPLAAPIYLGWKKGTFIDKALTARDAE